MTAFVDGGGGGGGGAPDGAPGCDVAFTNGGGGTPGYLGTDFCDGGSGCVLEAAIGEDFGSGFGSVVDCGEVDVGEAVFDFGCRGGCAAAGEGDAVAFG